MLCQRLRRHGAGVVRRHGHEPLGQRCQQRQHLVHVLVGHDADQKDEFLPGEAVFQALHCGAHPVGVVAAVQHKGRAVAQQLKAPGPAYLLQSGADGAFRDVPALLPQHPQGGDGQRGVAGLIAADERQAHPVQPVKAEGNCIQIPAGDLQLCKVHLRKGGVLLCRHPAQHSVCLRCAAVAYHRAARFDDARLGGGNIRQRGAQFLDVIHAQCGDHRAGRLFDDVGGIQRAAKPHLQHHDITLLLRKIEHSQCGDDLKLGGHVLHGVGGGLYLLHKRHQCLVRDLLPVDLDALVEPVDEGRGIQPHPVTGGLQAGSQHRRRAALAVGARYMDELQLFVRVAQCRQQGAGTGKPGLMPRPLHRVDVFHCLFVVHRYCLDSRNNIKNFGTPERRQTLRCSILRVSYFFASFIRLRFSSRMRSSTTFTALRMRALGMRTASVAHG